MRILSKINTVTKTTVRPSFKKGTILAILGNNIKSTSKVIEIVLIEQNEPEATIRITINFIIDTTLGFPFVQQCRKNAMPQKSYSHRVRYNAPSIFLGIDMHLNSEINKKRNNDFDCSDTRQSGNCHRKKLPTSFGDRVTNKNYLFSD